MCGLLSLDCTLGVFPLPPCLHCLLISLHHHHPYFLRIGLCILLPLHQRFEKNLSAFLDFALFAFSIRFSAAPA